MKENSIKYKFIFINFIIFLVLFSVGFGLFNLNHTLLNYTLIGIVGAALIQITSKLLSKK
ncbi:hypothetical protein [Clostridium frigidicarnis]|uniref:Uncharacterized protein n=1 Tax=Clostridium frigidicarnis TaxID=84698 RepID=A0A1I0YDA3_9CLOT|nr:hypothetical protein [Clostridium frigidicarnis]SFB11122.1 hypothetical protein SAMN04488528_101294 [Clostridium frigidicarnis]